MTAAEYRSHQETAYLLSIPANAERLLESITQARAGQTPAHALIEDDSISIITACRYDA